MNDTKDGYEDQLEMCYKLIMLLRCTRSSIFSTKSVDEILNAESQENLKKRIDVLSYSKERVLFPDNSLL